MAKRLSVEKLRFCIEALEKAGLGSGDSGMGMLVAAWP
jgi:hypothetical protein